MVSAIIHKRSQLSPSQDTNSTSEYSVFGINSRGILTKKYLCRDDNQNDKMHTTLSIYGRVEVITVCAVEIKLIDTG